MFFLLFNDFLFGFLFNVLPFDDFTFDTYGLSSCVIVAVGYSVSICRCFIINAGVWSICGTVCLLK